MRKDKNVFKFDAAGSFLALTSIDENGNQQLTKLTEENRESKLAGEASLYYSVIMNGDDVTGLEYRRLLIGDTLLDEDSLIEFTTK